MMRRYHLDKFCHHHPMTSDPSEEFLHTKYHSVCNLRHYYPSFSLPNRESFRPLCTSPASFKHKPISSHPRNTKVNLMNEYYHDYDPFDDFSLDSDDYRYYPHVSSSPEHHQSMQCLKFDISEPYLFDNYLNSPMSDPLRSRRRSISFSGSGDIFDKEPFTLPTFKSKPSELVSSLRTSKNATRRRNISINHRNFSHSIDKSEFENNSKKYKRSFDCKLTPSSSCTDLSPSAPIYDFPRKKDCPQFHYVPHQEYACKCRSSFSLTVPYTSNSLPKAQFKFNSRNMDYEKGYIKMTSEACYINIPSVEIADSGLYSLRLSTDGGSCEMFFSLRVFDKPSPPLKVKVDRLSGEDVSLSWQPPSCFGGERDVFYVVEVKEEDEILFHRIASYIRLCNYRIKGLKIGELYNVNVIAGNDNGESKPASIDVIPRYSFNPPQPPSQPHVNEFGINFVKLEWNEPSSDGGSRIKGYLVEQQCTSEDSDWINCKVEGFDSLCKDKCANVLNLSPSKSYKFRVSALNKAGYGNASPPSLKFQPREPPKAPVIHSDLIHYECSARLGSDVRIVIPFTAYPSPSVRWFFKKVDITHSPNYEFFEIGHCHVVLHIASVQYANIGDHSVFLENEKGADNFSVKLKVYGPPMPPIGPFSTTIISPTSLRISWTPVIEDCESVNAIIAYIVEYLENSYEGSWNVYCDDTSLNKLIVKNLNYGSTYLFRVKAQNKHGFSDYLTMKNPVHLILDNRVPSSPGCPEVVFVDDNSVHFEWQKPFDDGGMFIENYLIEHRENNGLWKEVEGRPVYSNYFVAKGLDPNSEYEFRVKAVNAVGFSEFSPVSSSVRLKSRISKPGKPHTPRISSLGKNYIDISCTAIIDSGGDHSSGYILEYALENSFAWQRFNDYPSYNRLFHIPKLEENEVYKFRLITKNSVGESEPSEILMGVKTGETAKLASNQPSIIVPLFDIVQVPNSELTLHVESSSLHPLSAKWFKNKAEIDATVQTSQQHKSDRSIFQLNLPDFKISDEGKYACCVFNEFGSAYSSCYVDALSPPTLIKAQKSVSLNEGAPARLKIFFSGSKPMTYKIKKDDVSVKVSNHFKVVMSMESLAIILDIVAKKDEGSYEITISNESGSFSHFLDLKVIGLPGPPKGPLLVSSDTKNEIRLSWNLPENNGGSSINYYILEKKIVSNNVWRTISPLCMETHYHLKNTSLLKECMFRVAAVNDKGQGAWLETERFHELSPILKTPSSVRNAKIAKTSETVATIWWEFPDNMGTGDFIGFAVEMLFDPEIGWTPLTSDPISFTEIKDIELPYSSNCQFRIFAINASGKGPSEYLYIKEDPSLKKKETIVVKIPLCNSTGERGKILVLECLIDSPDGSAFFWYKDEIEILNSAKYNIYKVNQNYTCMIHDFEREDQGNYKCVVKYGHEDRETSCDVNLSQIRPIRSVSTTSTYFTAHSRLVSEDKEFIGSETDTFAKMIPNKEDISRFTTPSPKKEDSSRFTTPSGEVSSTFVSKSSPVSSDIEEKTHKKSRDDVVVEEKKEEKIKNLEEEETVRNIKEEDTESLKEEKVEDVEVKIAEDVKKDSIKKVIFAPSSESEDEEEHTIVENKESVVKETENLSDEEVDDVKEIFEKLEDKVKPIEEASVVTDEMKFNQVEKEDIDFVETVQNKESQVFPEVKEALSIKDDEFKEVDTQDVDDEKEGMLTERKTSVEEEKVDLVDTPQEKESKVLLEEKEALEIKKDKLNVTLKSALIDTQDVEDNKKEDILDESTTLLEKEKVTDEDKENEASKEQILERELEEPLVKELLKENGEISKLDDAEKKEFLSEGLPFEDEKLISVEEKKKDREVKMPLTLEEKQDNVLDEIVKEISVLDDAKVPEILQSDEESSTSENNESETNESVEASISSKVEKNEDLGDKKPSIIEKNLEEGGDLEDEENKLVEAPLTQISNKSTNNVMLLNEQDKEKSNDIQDLAIETGESKRDSVSLESEEVGKVASESLEESASLSSKEVKLSEKVDETSHFEEIENKTRESNEDDKRALTDIEMKIDGAEVSLLEKRSNDAIKDPILEKDGSVIKEISEADLSSNKLEKESKHSLTSSDPNSEFQKMLRRQSVISQQDEQLEKRVFFEDEEKSLSKSSSSSTSSVSEFSDEPTESRVSEVILDSKKNETSKPDETTIQDQEITDIKELESPEIEPKTVQKQLPEEILDTKINDILLPEVGHITQAGEENHFREDKINKEEIEHIKTEEKPLLEQDSKNEIIKTEEKIESPLVESSESGSISKSIENSLSKDIIISESSSKTSSLTSIIETLLKETENVPFEDQPPSLLQELRQLVAYEGDTLKLECKFSNAENFTWFFNGEEIQSNDSYEAMIDLDGSNSLFISNICIAQQGKYSCTAENSFGSTTTHSNVEICKKDEEISEAHDIVLITKLTDSICEVGENMTFSFEYEGCPDPNIEWTFNAEPILAENVEISVEDDRRVFLTISKTVKENAGIYVCSISDRKDKLNKKAAYTDMTLRVVSPEANNTSQKDKSQTSSFESDSNSSSDSEKEESIILPKKSTPLND